MDIDRARTFLEIVHTGSFLRAAERLHVTQTTVSARIRTLEDELGRRLFIRNRNGARLTPAGVEFERFAQTFVRVWERARQQLAVPPGKTSVVGIGAELSLWNPLLVDWMVGIRNERPEIAVRAQVGLADQMVEELRAGTLDIALLYAPRLLPGFEVEPLLEEQLVLVRTPVAADDARTTREYVHVDWGAAFAARHRAHAPDGGAAETHVGFGPLGLAYILRAGGAGYFRRKMVSPLVEAGRLEFVANSPGFTYPAYAVYPDDPNRPELRPVLAILRNCLASDPAVTETGRL